MKKTILALIAAAIALPGCQKNETPDFYGFEFTSLRPADETRTGWTGETIEWTAGDAISMAYTVDGAWEGPNLYPSTPLAQGGPTARFSVPGNFTSTKAGEHRFYTVYPAVSSTGFPDAPVVQTSIPEIQTPTESSFDPSADLMAGFSAETYPSRPTEAVPLKWTRLTAHGDITLKGLSLAEDETVSHIVLKGQAGASLTGPVRFSIDNPDTFTAEGSALVTVTADNLSVAGGELRFWISIFPVTLTELEVTLITDKATYVKSFTGISKTFARNARNTLGIRMDGATRIGKDEGGEAYVCVSETPADWTGEYLIVYPDGEKALNGGLQELDAVKNTIDVTIQDDAIAKTDETAAASVTISRNGSQYTIRTTRGTYIGKSSDANGLSATTNVQYNTLSYGDGYVDIVSSGGAHLRFNAASDQMRFRYYKSSSYSAQKAVKLFRLTSTAAPSGPPSVTTGAATATKTSAILQATFSGSPIYGGFEWGPSPDNLDQDWQAAGLTASGFRVEIDGLGSDKTYYYRAYIAVLEGKEYVFYYGDIRSFTTSGGEVVIGDRIQWYEVPQMNITRSGKYMMNAEDASQYYAVHLCSGGETGPQGKTARNYTVCFSATHHCPLWVAAPRHAMYVGGSGRNDRYRRDDDVPLSYQYSSTSTGGGCNKGHMLGSAERTSSVKTNQDVFYYTNIAPQLSGFNTGGGGWNILEDFVDTKVCADTLYEVVGCYFDRYTYTDSQGATKTIEPTTIQFGGRSDVSMPTMFYYVLIRTKRGNTGKALKDCAASELQCAAFVRPHTNDMKGVSVTSADLMSVTDLEALTGVTYFPNVPNAPKSTLVASDWGL